MPFPADTATCERDDPLRDSGTSPAPAADEREYVYDQPHFFGTKRNGPDLSRVGGKYSDDWQYSHLYNPAQMTPGSIMPQFSWLFKVANSAVRRAHRYPLRTQSIW